MADHSRVEMLSGDGGFDPLALQQLLDAVMADRPEGDIKDAFEKVMNAAHDLLRAIEAHDIKPDSNDHPGVRMAAGIIGHTFTAIEHWLTGCCAGRLVSFVNNLKTLEMMREAAERQQAAQAEFGEVFDDNSSGKIQAMKVAIKTILAGLLPHVADGDKNIQKPQDDTSHG